MTSTHTHSFVSRPYSKEVQRRQDSQLLACSTRTKKKEKKFEEKKLGEQQELGRFGNYFQTLPDNGNSGQGDGVVSTGKYQYFSYNDSIFVLICATCSSRLSTRLDSRKSVRWSFGFFLISSVFFILQLFFFFCFAIYFSQARAHARDIALGQVSFNQKTVWPIFHAYIQHARNRNGVALLHLGLL